VSRGIPRTISVICDNALLTGFAIGQRPVNSNTIREVCRDFDLAARDKAPQPEVRRAAPVDAPPANLLVIGPAGGESTLPRSEVTDGSGPPSDESLRELYDSGSPEAKRRTFSFLRG
jgi:hypothetical protein